MSMDGDHRGAHGHGAIRGPMGRMLFAGIFLAMMPGCQTPPPPPVTHEQVWPPPPAEARIAYEKSLYGPEDLGIRKSAWKKLAHLLTGVDKSLNTFSKPFGIALDENDNLCVADPGIGAVWFFDMERARVQRWQKIGAVSFSAPVALAKAGDVMFVADSGLGQVLAFNTKGKLLFQITDAVERPTGLAIYKDALFVVDSQAHCVFVFDLQGRLLRQFGSRGTAPGEFNAPTHIAIDEQGRIYVADSLNFRVQVFNETGGYEGVIGSMGDSSGHFSRPKGVAIDQSGHVYVVDALFDNVQVFDRTGLFLLHWGSAGSKPGEFWLPSGVAIDKTGRIYVADSYNRRVQVFQYVGAP